MTEVVLLGRPGCHLCDEARTVLRRIARARPLRWEERDIETDPALLRRYLERIPVVLVDGAETCELVVDEAVLQAALDRADTRPGHEWSVPQIPGDSRHA